MENGLYTTLTPKRASWAYMTEEKACNKEIGKLAVV